MEATAAPSGQPGSAAAQGLDDPVVAAAIDGDQHAFSAVTERHRRELRVHCYRMLGSLEEAEDHVQETFVRAWRKRETFEGRSTFRAWLYRIATNACLETIRRNRRRTGDLRRGAGGRPPPSSSMPWLDPYPDRLLDEAASTADTPETLAVARETIELAYLVAIQLLPPRQRAVLIMREVLAFSAAETATVLDTSVAAVNSALQRARATMSEYQRSDTPASVSPSASERRLLERFIDAHEHADPAAVIALLREDARLTISPAELCWDGRDAITPSFMENMNALGEFRCVETSANREPAVAMYLRAWGDTVYRAFTVVVLHVVGDQLVDIMTFARPELFPAFGLAPTL